MEEIGLLLNICGYLKKYETISYPISIGVALIEWARSGK